MKLKDDIENIGKISIVPTILNVICRTTGMGFAAVARVTESDWVACSVHDEISFGLAPGGSLQIETTICNEIRNSGRAVIIDNVGEDENFKDHHTPLRYGFQSYISIPIIRKDHTFFGTLCAIDPNPHKLNTPEVIDMFTLFADLISFHLDAIEQLDASKLDLKQQITFNRELDMQIGERTLELESKNDLLMKTNKELQEFRYISSHDFQEPLRKIQTFVSLIEERESSTLSANAQFYFERIKSAALRMNSLIGDLLSYGQTAADSGEPEQVDLAMVIHEILADLKNEIEVKSVDITIKDTCTSDFNPKQLRKLLYNLIQNSLKFSSSERKAKIEISAKLVEGSTIISKSLPQGTYCHLSIVDNGIGFSQKYEKKIFELFQKLHHEDEYGGTGIGLAVVKKIVEKHGGIIFANGELNQGAEFNLFFPTRNNLN